jgi:PAS domain S-box-containing protein
MPAKSSRKPFRNKELLFDLITGNLMDAVVLLDAEGKKLYISPALGEILGYAANELEEWVFFEQIHPDDMPSLQESFSKLAYQPTGESENLYRQKHKQGYYVWLEMKLRKISQLLLPSAQYVATLRDVSQRIITEQKDLVRKNLIETAFHLFPCNVIIADKENKLIFVNEYTMHFFGLPTGVSQPKTLYELLPEDAGRFVRDNALVWQTGKEIVKEDIFQTIDKVYIVLIGRKLIQPLPNGEKLLLAYAIDITERKIAEKETDVNRNFIRSIALTIPDILYVYDLEERKYLFTNNGFEKVLGYTTTQMEEMSGTLIQTLVHSEDAPLLMDMFTEIARGEKDFFEYSYRLRDSSGTYRWFNSRKMAFKKNSAGSITQILGFAQDIHLRRQMEEDQQKSQQALQAAMRAKDEFFSVMSHEIRTPMNAVIGMTRLLLQNNPRPDQLKLLQTLEFAGGNLLSLLNDLLDFSKIEAGKVEFSQSDFNLLEIIQHVYTVYKTQAEEKKLFFYLELDKSLPGIVKGDSHRLSQILSNLLSNAIKFTHHGGIYLSVFKEKETSEFLYIRIQIKDTGIGIAPEKLSGIFDPFKQASSNTSRKYGGTGLGLAIIKSLIEQQGGSVEVESEPEVGSTFTVNCTFKKSAGIADKSFYETELHTFASLQGLRVLYVEDVLSNQILMEEICKQWDVSLHIASNGKEAIEKFQQHPYDLILMDIQMPGMDGYETTQIIRRLKTERAHHIPITALTADISEKTRSDIVAAGMNEYITKPIEPDALYSILKKYTTASLPGQAADETAVEPEYGEQTSLPAINFNLFDQLFLITPGEYISFLQTYMHEFDIYHQDFRKAVLEKDYVIFRKTRHKINTAIHHLKAEDLKEVLLKIDNYLKENAPTFSPYVMMTELQIIFDKIQEEILSKIKSLQ